MIQALEILENKFHQDVKALNEQQSQYLSSQISNIKETLQQSANELKSKHHQSIDKLKVDVREVTEQVESTKQLIE